MSSHPVLLNIFRIQGINIIPIKVALPTVIGDCQTKNRPLFYMIISAGLLKSFLTIQYVKVEMAYSHSSLKN